MQSPLKQLGVLLVLSLRARLGLQMQALLGRKHYSHVEVTFSTQINLSVLRDQALKVSQNWDFTKKL